MQGGSGTAGLKGGSVLPAPSCDLQVLPTLPFPHGYDALSATKCQSLKKDFHGFLSMLTLHESYFLIIA